MDSDNAMLTIDPVRLSAWCVIFAVAIGLLIVGQSVLVPLVIAILLWNLLAAIRDALIRWLPGEQGIPRWLATTLAILLIVVANYLVVTIVIAQLEGLTEVIPVYQKNFEVLLGRIAELLRIDNLPTMVSLINQLDLGAVLTWLGNSVGALVSDFILIAIYIGFMLAEEQIFPDKVRRVQSDPGLADRFQKVAADIGASVKRYIGMKTAVSLLTGLVSYAVLALVGVDFAALWALLIFFLNFIPNIGSAIGVVFPVLLTLVQFETLTPFLIVLVGLGATEFIIGNVVEPAYMGQSLNLSSLMILLSLAFWGTIWGLAGMFLAVPLMVVTAIICSHVNGLRWIAVLLSADGRLLVSEE